MKDVGKKLDMLETKNGRFKENVDTTLTQPTNFNGIGINHCKLLETIPNLI